MRVVFMGTPDFAAIILADLVADHQAQHVASPSIEVVGVFTQPDAIRSRGKKLEPSPVKRVALDHGLPVFEYATFKENDALAVLEGLAPDVICVAAYGVILPAGVIDLPRFGCLNVHGSLLPRWRGAAPIERAILAGDTEVGVCIMQMEEGLDTGAYCLVRSLPVGDMSTPGLTVELAHLGAEALASALGALEGGSLSWVVQDGTQATYANKIEKGELDIDPSMSATDALRKIRASSENHLTKACIGGKDATVVAACGVEDGEIDLSDLRPGYVVFKAKRLFLGFDGGALELLEVHPSGKKRMSAKDFAAGLQGVKQGSVTWSACER